MKKAFGICGFILLLSAGIFAVASTMRRGIANLPAADQTPAPLAAQGFDPLILINAEHPLPKGYVPQELVNLSAQPDRTFEVASEDIKMESVAYQAMNAMFKVAAREGVTDFTILSGYRDEAEQKTEYEKADEGTAAQPGASEHESGLAFDVTFHEGFSFEGSPQFDWLSAHCWEHGFILRYPKGAEHITGIAYESWHYRYVGKEASLAMRDKGQTLEEYLGAN